jgi:hypothetical protein
MQKVVEGFYNKKEYKNKANIVIKKKMGENTAYTCN